jgi:hypothetical protein
MRRLRDGFALFWILYLSRSKFPLSVTKVVVKSATCQVVFAVDSSGLIWHISYNGAALPPPNQKSDWGKEKNL